MSKTYEDLDLTTFPEIVDQFKTWLNITSSDGPLIQQYIEAVHAGNIVLANQILLQIPSGTQKIIKANDLNKLSQAMLAMERFYKVDIEPYVNAKQAEWVSILNQFDYKGNWSSGTSYGKDNMVTYVRFGVKLLYIAIKNVPTGTPTSDTRYWRQLTIEGQQGISGKGLSYRDEWNVSTQYSLNDAVTYGGSLWEAILPSKGKEPTKTSSEWKLVMSLETTTYPIQSNQPQNQQIGGLWFNTKEDFVDFYHLAPLTNPATESDITKGKQAYDDKGRIIIGTLSPDCRIEWNTDLSSGNNWN